MAILKNKIRNRFSTIPNSVIRCKDLSDGDYRLLIYLYSLPDDWEINQNFLAQEMRCNLRNVNAKIKRIKESGYLEIVHCRKKHNFNLLYVLKEKDMLLDDTLLNDTSVTDTLTSVNDIKMSLKDTSLDDVITNNDITNNTINRSNNNNINNNIISSSSNNIITTTNNTTTNNNVFTSNRVKEKEYKEKEIDDNLYDYIQENFGRTLSPIECELIKTWKDTKLTRYAIKQAVLRGILNFKYIDRILLDYEKNKITTVEQAEKKEEDFKKKKNNKVGKQQSQEEKAEIFENFKNNHKGIE